MIIKEPVRFGAGRKSRKNPSNSEIMRVAPPVCLIWPVATPSPAEPQTWL